MVAAITRVLTRLQGLRASQPDVQFTYRDMGAERIGEQMSALGNLALTIGFQGQTALVLYDRGEVNVATVALFNEFGTQNMPARPFMRRSVAENLRELQDELATHFGAVAELRETAIEAMDAVGRFMAEKMVEAIDTAPTWAAPLAPSTIKRKGHADPLVETGLMRKSITWAVRTGGPLGSIVSEGQVS